MTKAKKLPHPKMWLVFDDEGRLIDWASHRLGIAKSGERVCAYTSARKSCRWEPSGTFGWWNFSCQRDKVTGDMPRIYCQFCGGKVKR